MEYETAYDFKSITFCNLNTAGVDTYNDLPLMTAVNIITHSILSTLHGITEIMQRVWLRYYKLQQCQYFKCAGQISGVHFCNSGAYKDENKRKLNKILLFVVMSMAKAITGRYWRWVL